MRSITVLFSHVLAKRTKGLVAVRRNMAQATSRAGGGQSLRSQRSTDIDIDTDNDLLQALGVNLVFHHKN